MIPTFALRGLAMVVCVLAIGLPASAQLVILPSAEEIYDLEGPAEIELTLGTAFNVRLGPVANSSAPGTKKFFPFASGVPVPFVFEYIPPPPTTGLKGKYFLTVGSGGPDEVEITMGAAGILVDVIMIDVESDVAGASVSLVNAVLTVPAAAGVAGSFLVPVGAVGPGAENIFLVAGPDMDLGFVLTASVLFESLEPLPSGRPLVRIRMRTQVDNALSIDLDRDGILNEVDNCPLAPNFDQADTEIDPEDPDGLLVVGDGVGDACDNCVSVINPDQLNLDDDDFGVACDTCPGGCITNPEETGGEDCSNDEQANPLIDDPDGDGVGRICDNCPSEFNPEQENASPNTHQGDACEVSNISLDGDRFGGPPPPSPADDGTLFEMLNDHSTALPPDTFRVAVDCGGVNLTSATLSIRVPEFPGNVSGVRFGVEPHFFDPDSGCQLELFDPTNPGRFLEKVSTCQTAGGLDPALLQLAPDGVPAGPGSRQTHVRGPEIADPSLDSNLYVIQLYGNRTEPGFTDKILCLEGETVEVGLIRFLGLVSGLPMITTDGQGDFTPPLVALQTADGGPVPQEGLTFTTGPPDGSQIFDLNLGPALSGAGRQLTLLSFGPLIQQAALCLHAPVAVTTSQMDFADCTLAGAQPYQRTCPANTASDLALGPLVDVAISYVVPPNQSVAGTGVPASLDQDGDGFAPDDAICVVLAGDPNVNDPGVDSLLGIVSYQDGAEGVGLPRIEFPFGLLDLPGVGDFIVATEPVSIGDIRVVGSFDQDGDDDGDLVPNFSDNCVKVSNSDQSNNGAALVASANADAVGDACQCCDGESANNGTCFPIDLAACQQALADIEAGLDPGEAAGRCSVTGDEQLTADDILFLDLVLLGGGETADVKFRQVCPAATGL